MSTPDIFSFGDNCVCPKIRVSEPKGLKMRILAQAIFNDRNLMVIVHGNVVSKQTMPGDIIITKNT